MTKKVRPYNTILNIAGGKIQPLDLPDYPYFLVNLDTMYFNCTSVMDLEIQHENFKRNGPANIETKRNYVNFDVYEFLERYRLKFDSISIYRFMEHVPLDKLLYFIYLLSTSVVLDGTIDVIVPNIEILSHKILKERDLSIDEFPAHDILVTTEVVNEPSSPHLSLWSPLRAKYYFELEKRFVVDNIVTPFEFDGREIYMRFSARRVK